MAADDGKRIEGEPVSGAHRMSHQEYLGWLLFFMSGVRFKQAVVRQAIRYAEVLLPPPVEDQGERELLSAAVRWAAQPSEENARAATMPPWEAKPPTRTLQWTFTWAADTQPEPHATPAVAYVAKAVQFAVRDVPHEARMVAAELAQARARQWQVAAATAIAQGKEPPEPDGRLEIATGSRGSYLEGRPALLVHRMSAEQRLRFKQAVVRHAIEQAERVLPPEAEDKGHRRCLEAARRWLDDPSEENAKAAWTAAWVGIEGAPSYPTATQAESAAWLAARGTAEAAGEADTHRAALLANVQAQVTIVLEGVTAAGKRAEEATQHGKDRYLEIAWRILQGQDTPANTAQDAQAGESFGAAMEQMSRDQSQALAAALERQARRYGERAYAQAPAPWLDRPESGERSAIYASPGANTQTSLENQVGNALRDLAAVQASVAEAPQLALRKAAESVWKAATYAGEWHASEWQVEAAWAILRDMEIPPLEVDVL